MFTSRKAAFLIYQKKRCYFRSQTFLILALRLMREGFVSVALEKLLPVSVCCMKMSFFLFHILICALKKAVIVRTWKPNFFL